MDVPSTNQTTDSGGDRHSLCQSTHRSPNAAANPQPGRVNVHIVRRLVHNPQRLSTVQDHLSTTAGTGCARQATLCHCCRYCDATVSAVHSIPAERRKSSLESELSDSDASVAMLRARALHASGGQADARLRIFADNLGIDSREQLDGRQIPHQSARRKRRLCWGEHCAQRPAPRRRKRHRRKVVSRGIPLGRSRCRVPRSGATTHPARTRSR